MTENTTTEVVDTPDEPKSTAASRVKCDLCGLTCPTGRPVDEVHGKQLRFCCPGCRHVYEMLVNLSDGPPEDFKDSEIYQQCLAAGIIPADQAELEKRESSGSPKSSESSGKHDEAGVTDSPDKALSMDLDLKIDGMWCTACAWLIENAVGKIEGVLDARVHFLSDAANIRYFPFQTGPEAIIEKISSLGYRTGRLDQDSENERTEKQMMVRLAIAAILTVNVMMISFALYYGFIETLEAQGIFYLSIPLLLMATPVIFYAGWPILHRAAIGLRHRSPTMDTLIAVGALSAYGYSILQITRNSLHLYFDTATMLITMVLLGKFIEYHARGKVSAGLSALYRLANRKVRILEADGPAERWVVPEAAENGCRFGVRAGETVPLDGKVLAGTGVCDLSILNGESRPVNASPGIRLMAGSRLTEGSLTLEALGSAGESSLNQMIRLMQEALGRKNDIERLADRLTRRIVPAIIFLAAATAGWMLLTGYGTDEALLRAITVLVITCPCALGIATPLAKVAALGVGRSRGILIRDAHALEKAEHLDTFVLDKTGTLTYGKFQLREIITADVSRSELLRKMAAAEAGSDHFLAREIMRTANLEGPPTFCADTHQDFDGMGIVAITGNERISAGNRALMEHENILVSPDWNKRADFYEENGNTVIFCAVNGELKGLMVFGDTLKETVPRLIEYLKNMDLDIWLVSGDSDTTTKAVARRLGIENAVGNALPEDKVEILRRLQSEGKAVGMLGDGINDAAVLAAADVGIALGAGENLLQNVSDLTIASKEPWMLVHVLGLSALTGRTIRQNLFFAFVYNLAGIPLAIFGFLNPFLAVTAMFASSMTVIGNTLRITRFKSAGHEDKYSAEIEKHPAYQKL